MNVADAILGRRYEYSGGEGPDVTVIAVDPVAGTARLHGLEGQRETVPLAQLLEAIESGALLESQTGAPFQLPEKPLMVTIRRHGRTEAVPLISVIGGDNGRR